MNVYQTDTADEVPSHRNEIAEPVADEVPEPTKRESTKPSVADEKDISDVVKQWSKK